MQPFHTWDTASPGRHAVPAAEGQTDTWALEDDEPVAQSGSQTDLPAADVSFDSHGDTDSGPVPVMDCDFEDRSAMSVSDSNPADTDRYNLRLRRRPRITSGWSANKWTNSYHTDRLDLK